MADEGSFTYTTGESGVYAIIATTSKTYWSTGSTLQADFDIAGQQACTEHDGSSIYYFNMPAVIAGWYVILIFDQVGILRKSFMKYWDSTNFLDGTNLVAINGDTTAASNLEKSAASMVQGTVDSSVLAPTAAIFEADDIVNPLADHYNLTTLKFTSGALSGQTARILDYELSGANGKFTVSGLTQAPANDDAFIVI